MRIKLKDIKKGDIIKESAYGVYYTSEALEDARIIEDEERKKHGYEVRVKVLGGYCPAISNKPNKIMTIFEAFDPKGYGLNLELIERK
jgi:hypothetical protein